MSNETQTPPTATTNEGQAAVAQDVTAATAAVDSGQPQQAPATEAPATTTTDTPTASVETAAKPAQAEGAPAAYEFTAPDGVTLDEQVVVAFKASAKELNLTNEAAQKLLSSMAPVMAARQAEQLQAHQQEWRGQAEADQEIGGVKLTESLATAKKRSLPMQTRSSSLGWSRRGWATTPRSSARSIARVRPSARTRW